MKKLLNFSTHPGDPEMFGNDWTEAAAFLNQYRFDGFELYPVGNYPFQTIPPCLVRGIHLRFFIFLREIWENNGDELLKIFDNWENVEHSYGGRGADAVITTYVKQLDLAQQLACHYVVFHPVHCLLAHIYDWQFPYSWQDTLTLCSEILNESLARSSYTGLLLFENLWWPGSFRLEDIKEYHYLRERVNYKRCGIVLDTGHLLNSCGGFDNEEDGIDYLLGKVGKWGSLRDEIRTVHLTLSLSGRYIRESKEKNEHPPATTSFRQRFSMARQHVCKIDPHDPFTNTKIGDLFDLINPDNVVFEFTFNNLGVWCEKIEQQQKALLDKLWL